jgi:hypothetical protein
MNNFYSYFYCCLACCLLAASPTRAAWQRIEIYPQQAPPLKGPEAGQQLIVTGIADNAPERDIGSEVTYTVEPSGILAVNAHGFVTPLANGKARVIAKGPGNLESHTELTVEQIEGIPEIHFPSEIVPLFTKYGCNSGGCHGKSGGQKGFRLSLFGYEPEEDYDHLVKESRMRRLFPAAPEHSLLLKKASGEMPHKGGIRIDQDGYTYRMIVEWMRQGMPYANEEAAKITHISVYPRERIMQPQSHQQLVVTAHFDNETTRDITRVSEYESNDKDRAEVDHDGRVTIGKDSGTSAVMVRFQEFVDVFQSIIPLGAAIQDTPTPNNFIDEYIMDRLKLLGLPPSPDCDDATFIRRVTIDLAGRIPTPEESQAFLNEGGTDKRAKLIDRLLEDGAYADYFANKWNAILRNKRTKPNYIRGTFTFHAWIRESFYTNKPYDQFMRELVTASGDMGKTPPVAWYRQLKTSKEQLQDTAQIFLGVRLQCAECHHHPYEKWSQRDYYGFEAFFKQVARKQSPYPGEEIVYHRRGTAQSSNPKTKQVLKPTVLEGEPVDLPPESDPRIHLADWIGNPDNPFFARMVVNRYWKHFMGRGLVEPEDDMRVTNPPTHPQLLDRLAQEFVKSGYDLKQLCRTITRSRTYQLTSLPNDFNVRDKQNYSRYYPKRLNAEVLLDAIDELTGHKTPFKEQPSHANAVQLPDDSFNGQSFFLEVFGRPEMDSACECERSSEANLAQTLHLLNAKSIQDKIAARDGTSGRLAGQKDVSDTDKIYTLYARALSREPVAGEIEASVNYLMGKEGDAKRDAYQDIVWALINTKEFLFNH